MCLRLVKIADWSLVRPLSIVIRTRSKTYVLPSGNNTFWQQYLYTSKY